MARTRLWSYAVFALTIVAVPVPLSAAPPETIDLNRASLQELLEFRGIGRMYAEKVVRGRPYRSRSELVARHILPAEQYLAIKSALYVSPVDQPVAGSRAQGYLPAGAVDLNTATRDELASIPGIGTLYVDKIIRGRPYYQTLELVGRRIMPLAVFEGVDHRLVVR
jgi:DNA uptake protein ComE-like DNA-binding protein